MADDTRDLMVKNLLEMREQQRSAHGMAEYMDREVRSREEALILLGIPLPPSGEGEQRQADRVQENETDGFQENEAAVETPPGREDMAERTQADAGEEETPTHTRVVRCRLEDLRQIPEAQQTPEQRKEERLLERIESCSHHPGMMKVIASEIGNRFLLTDAAILIFNTGRSPVPPRALAGQLRNNVVKKHLDYWKILDQNSERNEVQFFPNGDALKPQNEGKGNTHPGENSQDRNGILDGREGTSRMLPLESDDEDAGR